MNPCVSALAPRVDLVDGRHVGPTHELVYATTARGYNGDCGEDGALYELEADPLRRFRNAWQAPLVDVVKTASLFLIWIMTWHTVLYLTGR